jgi:hypothetical protein
VVEEIADVFVVGENFAEACGGGGSEVVGVGVGERGEAEEAVDKSVVEG